MIKVWLESAHLSLVKGKYNYQVAQSSGYNHDSSDQSRTRWANSMHYRVVSL